MIERVPKRQNPVLFDKLIAEIQDQLAKSIPWLSHIFGKAERLIKKMPNGRTYYTPNIYIGGNEYELIAPDINFGNYCFFTLEEPQDVSYVPGDVSTLHAPFSLIVWVDMRTLEDIDQRNTEWVKQQILRTLNGMLLRNGKITINKIYEKAENVFKGYTLDEIDNQYLMHPYAGFRFMGEMRTEDDCI